MYRAPGDGPPTRVLGLDLGERRIGVALGDLESRTAAPLITLSRGRTISDDARVIARLATEHRAGALVVGLPFDMAGGEGLQALKTREWAEAIAAATGLSVRYRDERLSSERAERRIGPATRGRAGGPPTGAQRDARRARIDREAAAMILQDEMDADMTGNTGTPTAVLEQADDEGRDSR
jgi:putative holliday junction resolvase